MQRIEKKHLSLQAKTVADSSEDDETLNNKSVERLINSDINNLPTISWIANTVCYKERLGLDIHARAWISTQAMYIHALVWTLFFLQTQT